MSIISISRGSYSLGQRTAEKLAEKLGYECISREFLLEASDQFHVPEMKLLKAIHDAPSLLDRFTYGKTRYIAYGRAALLGYLQKDNIIYHGLAGHFFLQGIPHILKVRIIANLDNRIKIVQRRDNVNADKARLILKKDDEERYRWSHRLYGIDTRDPDLYDMLLHIDRLTVDDAVDIILNTIKKPSFNTTDKSRQMINNLALAARIEAKLINEFPAIKVAADNGNIIADLKGNFEKNEEIILQIEKAVKKMEGVATVQINIIPLVYDVVSS